MEMFPKSDELISVTALVNIFKPNERGDDILLFKWHLLHKYWDYGYVAGAEVEYRKQLLIPILTTLKKLSAGLNASYLYSNQELNADKVNRNGIPSWFHKKQKENSLVHLIYY
jgi:hypothetical protein